MKRMCLVFVICCVGVTMLAINLNLVKNKRGENKLMLHNIEALAGDEDWHDEFYPCNVAGGICFKDGKIFHGISME